MDKYHDTEIRLRKNARPERHHPPETEGRKRTSAIIVEHSDSGGQQWDIAGIHWSVESAVKEAREIPWDWRLRHVNISQGNIVSADAIFAAEKRIKLWNEIEKECSKKPRKKTKKMPEQPIFVQKTSPLDKIEKEDEQKPLVKLFDEMLLAYYLMAADEHNDHASLAGVRKRADKAASLEREFRDKLVILISNG